MTLESVPREEVLARAHEHAARMAAASPNAVRGLVETLRLVAIR
jgi:enoyl-CoA hydratase/carnithine racemase